MDILEIRRAERCQEFELLDDEFTAGSTDVDRLRIAGVRGSVLRFLRGELGYRVEVLPPTRSLRLNSVDVQKRELRHGDRIEIGGVIIAFREAGKPWPVEPEPVRTGLDLKIGAIPTGAKRTTVPSSPRANTAPKAARTAERDESAARKERAPLRRRKTQPWLLWNALLVGGVLALILIRSLGSRGMQPNVQDLVSLAESQFSRAEYTAALQTLGSAEEKAPDAALRTRIGELRRKIEIAVARAADLPAARAAEADHREIQRFVDVNLGAGASRPAARELLRLTEAWSGRHGALAARHQEVDALRREVEAWRERFFSLAAPGEADRAEDVLFVADRCMRFERRRYSEAIAALDGYVNAHKGEPGTEAVARKLSFLREDGVRWLADHRAAIERMVQRGETARACGELRALLGGDLVPKDWLGDAAERLRALEGR